MKKIESIEKLKLTCIENNGHAEFFVMLNGGLRSSKDIYYEDGEDFYIINCIDDSEENMTEEELQSSIIGEAISKGAFYSYY